MPPIEIYLKPNNIVLVHIRGEWFAWHWNDRWQLMRAMCRCVVNEYLDFTANDLMSIWYAVSLCGVRVAE